VSLQYSHLVGGPVVQHSAVGGSIECSGAAAVVQIQHTHFGVITVDPANILQKSSILHDLHTHDDVLN
jgi:hypothetical protein